MRSSRPLQSKSRSPQPPAYHVRSSRSWRPLQSKRRSPKPPAHHVRSLRPLQSKRRSPKPPAHHVRSLRPLQSKRRSPKPPPHHVQGCQTATQVFCLSSFKPAPSKASMHIPGREHQSVLPDMRNGGPAVGVWSVATTVSVSASVDGECEPLWPSGTLPSPRRSPMPDMTTGDRAKGEAGELLQRQWT